MSQLTHTSSEDYWCKYRPSTSPTKSLFYRYENDGIIVYDSSARIFDEPAIQPPSLPESFKPRNKIDVMDGEEYGNTY
jgi:hypothetical protein